MLEEVKSSWNCLLKLEKFRELFPVGTTFYDFYAFMNQLLYTIPKSSDSARFVTHPATTTILIAYIITLSSY
jgi:broad specificity phosphatase PhoE